MASPALIKISASVSSTCDFLLNGNSYPQGCAVIKHKPETDTTPAEGWLENVHTGEKLCKPTPVNNITVGGVVPRDGDDFVLKASALVQVSAR